MDVVILFLQAMINSFLVLTSSNLSPPQYKINIAKYIQWSPMFCFATTLKIEIKNKRGVGNVFYFLILQLILFCIRLSKCQISPAVLGQGLGTGSVRLDPPEGFIHWKEKNNPPYSISLTFSVHRQTSYRENPLMRQTS